MMADNDTYPLNDLMSRNYTKGPGDARKEQNTMSRYYGFKSAEACFEYLGDRINRTDGLFCRGVWDTVLCWPAAKADSKIELPCPPQTGLVRENKAHRFCGSQGYWGDKHGGYSPGVGYTHYRNCYSAEAWDVYNRYLRNKTVEEKEFLKTIVSTSRTLELVGLCISLVSTIISLFIFCYFTSLKCPRTRIHKNLFVALIVQISMNVILYVDQLVAREAGGKVAGAASGESNAMYDTPVLCEILYSLKEYTKTVKFMWMFIEGLYLHNMIAVSVFSGKPNYRIYYAIAWGVPLLLTTIWVIPMSLYYTTQCWFGYYNKPLIWIIEGPRAAVMVVNLLFLLNIIRVLLVKLSDSHTNEANRVRKAVKAAIVLLPLLGLTNFVVMLEPSGKDIVEVSVYSFTSSFLIATEGFFISLLYCFLNGEVRQIIRRQWERYRQHRIIHNSSIRRMSRSLSIFTSFTEVPSTAGIGQKNHLGGRNSVHNGRPPPQRFTARSIFKPRSLRKQRESVSQPLPSMADSDDPFDFKSDLMHEDNV